MPVFIGDEKLAKHFIPYSSGSDLGPYEFEGTYGFTHGHNIPHTHLVANGHRQPGRGIRKALLKRYEKTVYVFQSFFDNIH